MRVVSDLSARAAECRTETVEREEVVLDKQTVQQPTTVVKPVKTDVPKVIEKKLVVPQLHEELRKLTVVRPRIITKTVKVMRPVEVTRKVKGKRPVVMPKTVKSKEPVRKAEMVNVTQPELSTYEAEVQVPYEEEKHVEYKEPVTVIRSSAFPPAATAPPRADGSAPPARAGVTRARARAAEKEEVARKGAVNKGKRTDKDIAEEEAMIAESDRDWNKIPVGLPFTELVDKAKNFTETKLRPEMQSVRHTKMEPKQVEKIGYDMKPVEVEISEIKMEEYEEEVKVWELQEVEEEVEVRGLLALLPRLARLACGLCATLTLPLTRAQVTVMEKKEEEWPVAKEQKEEVFTSTVTLEPKTAQVPEIAMEDVQVEVPRTVVKTEEIQKPVPVEREVMVDKPYTEQVEVEVEKPVEKTRQVEVEKPVTRYEERTVQKPVSVDKTVATQARPCTLSSLPQSWQSVLLGWATLCGCRRVCPHGVRRGVQEVKEQQQSFIEQTAFSSEKYMQYTTAESKMTAMAVDAGVKIGQGVDMSLVTEDDLRAAKHLCAPPPTARCLRLCGWLSAVRDEACMY